MNLMEKMGMGFVHIWTNIGRIFAFVGVCLLPAGGFAAESISITAAPRYPWNGKVDLKFTIDGTSGTKYDTSFTAKDVAGSTNLTMKTLYKSDGIAANVAKEQLLPGTYNWVWDATADLGDGVVLEKVVVEGKVVTFDPLYMVIDLSGGSSAKSYPVSYLDAVPSGGWNDTYKTTKLVLRRIKKGSNTAGGAMLQDMWVGVFEVTVKQWKLVYGALPEGYSGMNASSFNKNDTAPIVGIDFAGHGSETASLFLNPLKNKTVFTSVTLPTHDQWEFACRAGTTSQLNNGKSCTDANLKSIAWFLQNDYTGKTHSVGLLAPNNWGLYDMHGNADEQILNTVNARGGSYDSTSSQCTVAYKSTYAGGGTRYDGFRVFATAE